MSEIRISLVQSPEDLEIVRDLCRDYRAEMFEAFPEHRDALMVFYEPERFERQLAELETLHARPRGAILLARRAGAPAGCIMHRRLEPSDAWPDGTAEVKRLHVARAARGAGVGNALMAALIAQATADGCTELLLGTTTFLKAARRLYVRHGFAEVPPSAPRSERIRDVAVTLRRPLRRPAEGDADATSESPSPLG